MIINQGPSFGVHVIVTADRESELRPPVRSGFGSRVELRLAAVEDAKLVRSRFAKEVPVKPGRGMVAVNYIRLDSDPQAGLHTLVARPSLANTDDHVFVSDSVVAAVSPLATSQAPAVRRLPATFGLQQVRELTAQDRRLGVGAGGIAWGISELDLAPVYLNFAENSHLIVTGRRECGKTTTVATIMAEIGRLYAPGSTSAPPTDQPSAQVWLVDPRRQLLTVLGSEYVENFAYNLDGVNAMPVRAFAARQKIIDGGRDAALAVDGLWIAERLAEVAAFGMRLQAEESDHFHGSHAVGNVHHKIRTCSCAPGLR